MNERFRIVDVNDNPKGIEQRVINWIDSVRNQLSLKITDERLDLPLRQKCFEHFMMMTKARRSVRVRINK
jgi:hypothetical protein